MKKIKAFAIQVALAPQEAIAQMARLLTIKKSERWRPDRARTEPTVDLNKKSGYGTPGLRGWVCPKSLSALPSLLF